MQSEIWIIIIAIGGMVLSPIVSVLGILLSERRQINRDKAVGESEKKEAQIKEDETQILMSKASNDALNLYGSVISSLRSQMDAMIIQINNNTDEIALLVTKLNYATAEKERLSIDNNKLLGLIQAQDNKIDEQSAEIAELRKKIKILEENKSDQKE